MGDTEITMPATQHRAISLDSNGGTALQGPCGNEDGGRRLVLNEARLLALDLHDDPALEVIDLRGCGHQHHLHLQLDRLPRLREIYLPRLAGGAILHLFSLHMPVSLMVHGNVCEIDADWQQGTLRLAHPQRGWEGLRLLGHDAQPLDLSVSAASESWLTVVLDPALLRAVANDGELRLGGKGEVHFADAAVLERLVVEGPKRVSLCNAVMLKSLRLIGTRRFEGEGLDALREVDAGTGRYRVGADTGLSDGVPCGGYLTLRGQMRTLALADTWQEVQLYAPRLESLELGWARSLAMYHCGRLDAVCLPEGLPVDCHGTVPAPLLHVARFYIDEATLHQALNRLEEGEHALLDSILTMLPQRAGAASAFHGLTILLRLAEQGFDAEAIWQCRREMSAWQRIPQRRRQRLAIKDQDLMRIDGTWHWELPRDRFDEGMLADLRLWAICHPYSAKAHAYRKTLLDSCKQGDKFQLILRFGCRADALPPLHALMLDALVKEYGSSDQSAWLVQNNSQINHRYLVRLTAQDSLTAEQRQAVLGAISDLAPWETFPELISLLLQQHPGPVRAFLMTLSRRPDDWFQRRLPGFVGAARLRQARLYLTQLALMPPGALPPSNPTLLETQEDMLDSYLPIPPFCRR